MYSVKASKYINVNAGNLCKYNLLQAAAEASKCGELGGEKTDSSSDASKFSSKNAKERRNRRKKRKRQGEGEKEVDSNREGTDRKASFRFTADGKIRLSRERTYTSPHQVRKISSAVCFYLMLTMAIRTWHWLKHRRQQSYQCLWNQKNYGNGLLFNYAIITVLE